MHFPRTFPILVWLFISAAIVSAQPSRNLTRYVNPFIGTGGHGHTFPGATMPHGVVQLSPDTRGADWDGSSGYHYSDNIIYGFSHTHLSGTGIPDYCDILFAPYISQTDFIEAKPDDTKKGYASRFSHEHETAEAGYYSVLLEDENIFAEMTATNRAGFHRYTFPKTTNDAKIVLDMTWRDKVLESSIRIVDDKTIEGFRRSESWAKNQVVYFVAEFSKPFVNRNNIAVSNSDFQNGVFKPDSNSFQSELQKNIKAVFRFRTKAGEKILLKVGVSAVDIEGARRNLQDEIPDWNFDKVRRNAKQAWQKELSAIEVSGGSEAELTNFYTALYHTKIAPNIFQDVDGRFRGLDGKIHSAAKDTNYTIFSLWDTFRAAHPLYTIIDQRRTIDFINTFIRHHETGGRLPVWELAGNETDTMIGYHAVSVIADAMAKNIKGFDYEKAFAASKHSAELDHFGLAAYKRRGYISSEDEQESVSKTLEYAYNDWCIAQMAQILGKTDDYQKYIRRARSFENLFDAQTGFVRPKQNGDFVAPFQPQEVTFHFTEANSWQYSFFAPQDVSRLIELHGGREKFVGKLDELFTTEIKTTGREQPDITGLIGQYAHGNEPSHHIAYLYNFAGQPAKTQFYVRKIMDEFYKPTADGLIGNEDCGQMSAWYVLSAAGFYPVTPGGIDYVIGTPLFKQIKYNLENGKTFTIKAPNVSAQNFYIKSAKLNGENYQKSFITHADLMNGGVLEFEMTNAPNKTWATSPADLPVSRIERGNFAAVPVVKAPRTFTGTARIEFERPTVGEIRFTLDNSEPNADSLRYEQPFFLSETTTIKAKIINANAESQIVETRSVKKPNDWTVKIASKYNRQYTGGGDEGLIDGLRGTTNFASGEWQGYQAQDFVAVVDLQRETEIRKLGGGFLQVAESWIWMPTLIEFEISGDGVNFQKIAAIKPDIAPTNMERKMRDYLTEIKPTKARFVRVTARNLGKIPAWHSGAGFEAFIFVDEIFIQ